MQQNIKLNRQSNFELMRIVAMFLIILNHLCLYGGNAGNPNSSNLLVNCLWCWTGNLGNWLFILLSGYFISQSKFSWKRVFKVWFQIFSISATIGIVLYSFKIQSVNEPFTANNLIHCFLPTFFANNWFATAYILFYMFTPFLNESLHFFDEKKHRYLIILMVVVGTIIKMIPGQAIFESNYLFYFILGYYVGSYIRIYNPRFLNNQRRNIIIAIVFSLLFIVWIIIILHFKNITYISNNYIEVLTFPIALNRFPILFTAIFVFGFFKNLKINNNIIINIISGTTFGVYLIHENPFLNKIIWFRIFRINDLLYNDYLIFYILFAVITTFIMCSLLDLIWHKIIEKPILILIDYIFTPKK